MTVGGNSNPKPLCRDCISVLGKEGARIWRGEPLNEGVSA